MKACLCLPLTVGPVVIGLYCSHLSDPEEQCRVRMDLCLIIDASGSVRDLNPPGGPDNWQLQLDFFADFATSFPIGQDDTRVAAIVFSEQVRLVFPLNRFNRSRDIREAIRTIPYMGRTTNTPEALRQADLQCFNSANGDRDDRDNVIIIATDGAPYPRDRRIPSLDEARRLKNKGMQIIAIGITNFVDEDFLRGLSSGNNYFTVTNFEGLGRRVAQIAGPICVMAERGKYYVYLETLRGSSSFYDLPIKIRNFIRIIFHKMLRLCYYIFR